VISPSHRTLPDNT